MTGSVKDGFGPGGYSFWTGSARLASPFFRLLWGSEILGSVPPERPFLAAINHFSHLDSVLVGRALGPIRYLAVDELYGTSKAFDGLITWLGAIPMSRTKVPLQALRTALEYLDAGGVIGMYPEGRRVWTWGEARPKRGAAWLAHRAGVPLLPIAIWGTQESMGRGSYRIKRWPVKLFIAEPIIPADFVGATDPVGAMTDAWRQAIDDGLRQLGAPLPR
jgi:1-acyl-sn-glycerol-3-phosphate acyltransferase